MADPFASVQDRFDRAQEHFDEIRRMLRIYYAGDVHVIRGESDINAAMTMNPLYVEAPPERVNTLIGEMLHDLRSCLDHLAYKFVGFTPGNPTKDTYFPICKVRPMANKYGVQPPPPLVGGSTLEVMAFLDKHQPYQLDADFFLHGLWELHRLAIIDRHRHIVPKGVSIAPIRWTFTGIPPLGKYQWTARTKTSDEFGAELDLVLDKPHPDAEGHATLRILVNEPGPDGLDNPNPVPLMDLLVNLNDQTRTIVNEARALFFA